MKASGIKGKAKAEAELSKALKTIFALAENYPKLRASENFKLLQEQLEGVENKIAYARQFYNDTVLMFNNMITTIPGVWFAGLAGKDKKREFFKATEKERKSVKVEF
jgi:LemA protein